jgi:hypothetical protein
MSANPAEILLRSRRVTGADLSKLRSEHDAYEAMLKRANRGCAGASCRQGRQPCRENCPTFSEMSVWEDDAAVRAKTEGEAMWIIVVTLVMFGSVACWAVYAALMALWS